MLERERFEHAYDAVRSAKRRPGIRFSSSSDELYSSPEFRELRALGDAALPYLLDELQRGDFSLNNLVLELLHVDRSELSVDVPTEREVAAAILRRFDRSL